MIKSIIDNKNINSNKNNTDNQLEEPKKKFGRRNRGTRMNILSEEEAKKDDEFYNEYFEEKSNDEEFTIKDEESIEEVDSYDSDFFNEEEESEDIENSYDSERQRNREANRIKMKQIEKNAKPKQKNRLGFKNKHKNKRESIQIDKIKISSNSDEEKEVDTKCEKMTKFLGMKRELTESQTLELNKSRALRDRKEVNYSEAVLNQSKQVTFSALIEIKDNHDLVFDKKILKESNKRTKTKKEKYEQFINDQKKTKVAKPKMSEIEVQPIIKSIIPNNIISKSQIKDEKWDKLQKLDSQLASQLNLQNRTQKDLLLESIVTEIFNNQSLENLQRLEDLNKKEISGMFAKKKFNEFVKIKHLREGNINISFSKPEIVTRIFNSFKTDQSYKEKGAKCAITGEPAKYFDPLTKQYYFNKEAFKIIREKYHQREEESLLFRIQTLSDLASQKKEKLKKMLLSGSGINKENLMNIVSKIGIMKSDPIEIEKRQINSKYYIILFINKIEYIIEIEKIV
jgi:hypothetical protein